MPSIISLSREDLESWASKHIGFFGLDLKRISSVLLVQLFQIERGRFISVFSVTDELQSMEGLRPKRGTRAAEPFRGSVLKGLQKKHFTDAQFLHENMGAHFEMRNGGNARLKALVARAFDQNTSGFVDDDFCNTLAHFSTVAAIEERARTNRLTGEWIVFHRHHGENFYVTLASHREPDEEILKRVQSACSSDRFPFSY